MAVGYQHAQVGEKVTITLLALDTSGIAITGASDFLIAIQRESDGNRYDFASPFDFSASPGTGTQALGEVDATNAKGLYSFVLDTSAIVGLSAEKDTFYVSLTETGTDLLTIGAWELTLSPQSSPRSSPRYLAR